LDGPFQFRRRIDEASKQFEADLVSKEAGLHGFVEGGSGKVLLSQMWVGLLRCSYFYESTRWNEGTGKKAPTGGTFPDWDLTQTAPTTVASGTSISLPDLQS
jgi:hypothetical protein